MRSIEYSKGDIIHISTSSYRVLEPASLGQWTKWQSSCSPYHSICVQTLKIRVHILYHADLFVVLIDAIAKAYPPPDCVVRDFLLGGVEGVKKLRFKSKEHALSVYNNFFCRLFETVRLALQEHFSSCRMATYKELAAVWRTHLHLNRTKLYSHVCKLVENDQKIVSQP